MRLPPAALLVSNVACSGPTAALRRFVFFLCVGCEPQSTSPDGTDESTTSLDGTTPTTGEGSVTDCFVTEPVFEEEFPEKLHTLCVLCKRVVVAQPWSSNA